MNDYNDELDKKNEESNEESRIEVRCSPSQD